MSLEELARVLARLEGKEIVWTDLSTVRGEGKTDDGFLVTGYFDSTRAVLTLYDQRLNATAFQFFAAHSTLHTYTPDRATFESARMLLSEFLDKTQRKWSEKTKRLSDDASRQATKRFFDS